jgi:hypothetical protein
MTDRPRTQKGQPEKQASKEPPRRSRSKPPDKAVGEILESHARETSKVQSASVRLSVRFRLGLSLGRSDPAA